MRDFFIGFSYLWKGFRYLFYNRHLWWLVITPFFINLILLILILFAVVFLSSRWLMIALPEAWWATVVSVMLIFLAVILVCFLGIILFAAIGSIIGAPFYEELSGRVDREHGGAEFKQGWLNAIKLSFHNSYRKLVWFVLIQFLLLVLLAIPFIVGMVTYTVFGFIASVFFLTLEYLDFVFERRGLAFNERVRWCWDRKMLVSGFGAAIFLGLAVPIVNLFAPSAATIGAVLLYHAWTGDSNNTYEIPEILAR